jgi:3-deoxy-manno-octulosonate cytidylyltransferase (CMP-KDO synthetase)
MTGFKVVIPARYASERLPGKPLRDIAGKPMLQHVYERGLESDAGQVVIATDDERIEQAARAFGATVCMTGVHHQSGSDRLAEVAEKLGWPDDQVMVNLQGDEPMMPAALINQCAALLDGPNVDVATLASPLQEAADLQNPNIVKVVTDEDGIALYFSRASIPHSRTPDTDDLAVQTARHHHGIYAYRSGVLRQIVAAPPTALEKCERLEQLRALSLGLRIKVGIPACRPGPGVDTEQDLAVIERAVKLAAGKRH